MNSKILFPSLILMAAMATACHDDKGNYNYIDLDEVYISTPTSADGTEDTYTIDRGDNLTISPDVYFNGKQVINDTDAPLSYTWTLYTVRTGAGVDYTIDTLAHTRVLDEPVNRPGGSYYVQLTTRHNDTGIEAYYRALCNVEEVINEGWMLLYERNDMPGYSDVGFVVNPFSKNNIQKNKEFWNLYSSSNNDQPLEGKPVNIFHEVAPLTASGTPRIVTEKDFVAVNPIDFLKIMGWNDLFYDAPQATKIQFAGPTQRMNSYQEALILNNEVYVLEGGGATSTEGRFGMPKQSILPMGEMAPWACSRGLGALQTVVYSQTLGAFYYTVTGSFDYYSFGAQDAVASKFDVNNMFGMRMLCSDWNCGMAPTQNYDYFLFSRGSSRYVAVANFALSPALPNLGMVFTDVTSAPDIADATTIAVNPIGSYIYYGANNKVYTLAYDNGRATEIWSAPDSNEKVTCVSTHKFYYAMISQTPMLMPNMGNIVHIATWNEQKNEGHLYEYRINPASGQIIGDESYEYTVPGKVKAMAFKFKM